MATSSKEPTNNAGKTTSKIGRQKSIDASHYIYNVTPKPWAGIKNSRLRYIAAVCEENPKFGVRTGIGINWEFIKNKTCVSQSLPGPQTKHKAELRAAIRAISGIKDYRNRVIVINTQSEFIMTVGVMWLPIWYANRAVVLCNNQREEAGNLAEFKELYKVCGGKNIRWKRTSVDDFGYLAAITLAEKAAQKCDWYI